MTTGSSTATSNPITIRDARGILEYSIDYGIKRSLLFLGAPGVGKSDFIRQVAEEREMGLIDLRLLYFSESDLKGIPVPEVEKRQTSWLPNSILPNAERDGEKGILLIEEITSAPKRVQAAAYQLTLDRRLGEYILPEGWFIVAAGNREEDDGIFVPMPSPLANRFQVQEIVPDLDVWKNDYAYPRGVNPLVIAYLNFSRKSLHTQVPGENSMVFASPRSWVAVSDILNAGAPLFGGDRGSRVTEMMIRGNVGVVEGNCFLRFCKYHKSLSVAEDILEGRKYKISSKKELLFVLISSVVNKISSDYRENGELNRDWCENALRFFAKLPPEMMALGLRDICGMGPEVPRLLLETVDSPELDEFLEKNENLFW